MQLPAGQQQRPFTQQSFYRVFSLVNGGRAIEKDSLAGLRQGEDIHDDENS